MSSRLDFVQYTADQCQGAGAITYRKMFGEYGLYCNGKFFSVICDDQFFVKITDVCLKKYPELEQAPPYEGAGPYFLIDNIDDRDFLAALVSDTCDALPAPKEKKPAKKKNANPPQERPAKLDYKKEYKELYQPGKKPSILQIPPILYLMIDGKGDPNTSQAYQQALEILYGLSFAIKMSKMGPTPLEGYFEYVVPPLEGLWWTEDGAYDGKQAAADKSRFYWTSMIRQPEFVTPEVFAWAKETLQSKKPDLDLSSVRLETLDEGLCCQAMHIGPYDAEPATIEAMEAYILENGCRPDFTSSRRHHEIYLGDPRKTKPERLRTVIRHPVAPI
ncbi:MAG: GyrI-like domain-containing protein [Blautia sp.]|jgi:TfoX/Sxy family transcriptional regulator of competence genes